MRMESARMLRESGMKATEPRVRILDTLKASHEPLTAQSIWNKVKRRGIDRTTVYRTLHAFVAAGILRRIDFHAEAVFYEFAEHHHHHIVCTQCGIIEDFEICMMPTFTEHLIRDSRTFAQINEHSLELFGICNSCTDKSA